MRSILATSLAFGAREPDRKVVVISSDNAILKIKRSKRRLRAGGKPLVTVKGYFRLKTTQRGRSAVTGRIISVAETKRRPNTSVIETGKLDEDGRPLN